MTEFYLVKKGYGSLEEIRALDSLDFLDLVEYESMQNDIERYIIEDKGGE
jgi:hypothetical protein